MALGVARVDDEDQRLAGAVAQIDRGADGTQIVRARTSRNDDQFGDRDDRLDGHGDGRRGVDDSQAEALLAKHLEIGGEPRDRGLREGGHFVLPLVPPVGQRTLRVDVDQADGAGPAFCACTARCPDRVVFPDPPFCDAIARTRILFPSP